MSDDVPLFASASYQRLCPRQQYAAIKMLALKQLMAFSFVKREVTSACPKFCFLLSSHVR